MGIVTDGRRLGTRVRLACVVLAGLVASCGDAPPPCATGPGDAARGARLLAQYQCGSCHAIPGIAAAAGQDGPPLGRFGLRSYIAGRLPNRADLLARWIAEPAALVPGTTMPSMGVPPQDAQDMAAWLLEQR